MFKTQIESILTLDVHSRRFFQGCYAIDRLPNRHGSTPLPRRSAYVINYDEHDQPGSHWVAVFCDEAGRIDFFDSAGEPPLEDTRLHNFLGLRLDGRGGARQPPSVNFNPVQLQRNLSNACGFYSVYFILQRARQRTANDILHILASSNSDFVVKDHIYSRYRAIFT